jgi:hypothetical protein
MRRLLLTLSLLCPLFAWADETQMAVWSNEAIVATYSYNAQNYLERQKAIAKYFTSDGWIAYSKALNESKLPETVQTNNYAVSAVATLPPVIKTVAEGQWQAVMPLLVLYKNPQFQQKQTLQITMTFTAAPSGQGVRGFAMTSLQSKVIVPACKCPAEQVEDATTPAPVTPPTPATPSTTAPK